jgi:hypothetical protein
MYDFGGGGALKALMLLTRGMANEARKRHRLVGRRVGLLACVALAGGTLLAGCGGGGGTDSGGFTPSQFSAARDALAILGQTAVYDAALKISLTEAEVPTNCVVHLQQTNPLTFRVFLTWEPNQAALGGSVAKNAAGRSYSWLDAVIGTSGVKGDYSFHQGNERTLEELRTQYGDAFSKPVETCLVLQNQRFGLLPAGT